MSLNLSAPELQPVYKFFLTTFITPRELYDFPIMVLAEWHQALGTDPVRLTYEFEEHDLIVRAGLDEHLDQRYTVPKLKELSRTKGLDASGNKNDIIRRLIQSDPEGLWKDVSDYEIFVCTDRGLQVITKYLTQLGQDKGESLVKQLQTPAKYLKLFLAFISSAAVTGVIGNRADDIVLHLGKWLNDDNRNNNDTVSEPKFSEQKNFHSIEQGQEYIKIGQFDNAIDEYSEVIKLEPRNAEAYAYLGEAYWK